MTWPAKPPMRIFTPFMSSGVLISLRHQPPICAPVWLIRKDVIL